MLLPFGLVLLAWCPVVDEQQEWVCHILTNNTLSSHLTPQCAIVENQSTTIISVPLREHHPSPEWLGLQHGRRTLHFQGRCRVRWQAIDLPYPKEQIEQTYQKSTVHIWIAQWPVVYLSTWLSIPLCWTDWCDWSLRFRNIANGLQQLMTRQTSRAYINLLAICLDFQASHSDETHLWGWQQNPQENENIPKIKDKYPMTRWK